MAGALLLGVNVDHVATVRNARDDRKPSPVFAAQVAEQAGADLITMLLRQDRAHIRDEDVRLVRALLQTRLNLEIALDPELLAFAIDQAPSDVCLVPPTRDEPGLWQGLDVRGRKQEIGDYVRKLHAAQIRTSIFVDPDFEQIRLCHALGVSVVELHTGRYGAARDRKSKELEYARIKVAAEYASNLGLVVNAGHGLNYHNVEPIAAIPQIEELNIGHAIISHALIVGLPTAVREMKMAMTRARLQNRPPLDDEEDH
ncbi:pyridoxine 5'-phosphate synthase [Silvimonas sp. JCM 19000]